MYLREKHEFILKSTQICMNDSQIDFKLNFKKIKFYMQIKKWKII